MQVVHLLHLRVSLQGRLHLIQRSICFGWTPSGYRGLPDQLPAADDDHRSHHHPATGSNQYQPFQRMARPATTAAKEAKESDSRWMKADLSDAPAPGGQEDVHAQEIYQQPQTGDDQQGRAA